MVKPKVGDYVWIQNGDAHFRDDNPPGEIKVLIVQDNFEGDTSRFIGKYETGRNNFHTTFYYCFNEISKIEGRKFVPRKRKGRLIGEEVIQW